MGKRLDKVELSSAETAALGRLTSKGRHAARKVKRAQILLQHDKGKQPRAIAQAVGVSLATVYNVHGRYLAYSTAIFFSCSYTEICLTFDSKNQAVTKLLAL